MSAAISALNTLKFYGYSISKGELLDLILITILFIFEIYILITLINIIKKHKKQIKKKESDDNTEE